MNILYLHQYFKTPAQPGGTRSYWITKELISRGHKVTVISSSLFFSEKNAKKNIDGIEVIYINAPYKNTMGPFRRFLSFSQFMVKATWIALFAKDIDLVIATSTPLTIGLPALVLRLFKRIPYIFEVRDLWPEVPIQMGGLKNPLLINLAISFEKLIYKKALHIIALSPGMQEGIIKKGAAPEKISMIPNMAKIDKFWPREPNQKILKEYSINPQSFKVIHFGSMNIANGLDYILKAALIIKQEIKDSNIEFIFLGDGRDKKRCTEIVERDGLKSVFFLDKVPMDITSEIVNICNISLVPFLNLPVLATNSPNKLFDSLSAGKPVIVNSAGWTKDMVEIHKIGAYVNPNKPDELAQLIISWKDKPEEVKNMGKNARDLALRKYDKKILCKQFADIVDYYIKK